MMIQISTKYSLAFIQVHSMQTCFLYFQYSQKSREATPPPPVSYHPMTSYLIKLLAGNPVFSFSCMVYV